MIFFCVRHLLFRVPLNASLDSKPNAAAQLHSFVLKSVLTPPPIHVSVVGVVEQRRVMAWEFESTGARAVTTQMNILASISDGKTVAKFTAYEEFSNKFKVGGNYMIKGHSLRGQCPPFFFNISRETMFFRSAPIVISEDLKQQAEALLHPLSPLTPLSTCREAKGSLMTMEGEVVKLSTVKKISKGREDFPMLNIKLQQQTW
ncbi:uncharacterized protein LOC117745362 isoform X2 [Cyclopterus lumpus]|uniref:uncharacterized protein LOC117745362 isoform X2 n=1 Tax=Cyclopterus lumpus TaxID=8103 RepID=UPI001486FB8F|nr:uncharacterized protein LOC117745362 isoform X2 [Cyclopterus lumpus]